MRKCDICNKTDDDESVEDVLANGEWMKKQNVTVHYYCLLLSTNLPQRGGDSSGILGFLLRDIQREITRAQKRQCAFCRLYGASVECHKCKIVFHASCGVNNRCVNQFVNEFHSFCEFCTPLDDFQFNLMKNPPNNVVCSICFRPITAFTISQVTYGECCRQGFAHRLCMRRYAIASGYYLRCLWCRDKAFHDTIKFQSVFVPDRDASWERQPNAYMELHNKRSRCDHVVCNCPKGRGYNRGSWSIQLCLLCAATGAHVKCRLGVTRLPRPTPDFKCSVCSEVEEKLKNMPKKIQQTNDIDTSYYLTKKPNDLTMAVDDDCPALSDEDSASTFNDHGSNVTVIPSQGFARLLPNPSPAPSERSEATTVDSIIELPDTQPLNLLQLPQPPLLLCKSFTAGEHFYLLVFEYQQQDELSEPRIGTCTLRFALDDERLKDHSEETLKMLQLNESDFWLRDTNRGIYDKIDQYTNNFKP